MSRRLLTLVVLMTLSSCTVPAEDGAHTVEGDDVPFGLLNADAPALLPTPPPGPAHTVVLCFVEEGTLAAIPRPTTAPPLPLQVIEALAVAPESGGRSLRTAVGDANVVRSVDVQAGIATVDLRSSISLIGGADQLLAVAQIVCTLTGLPGIGQVS